MATGRQTDGEPKARRRRPAITPQGRENRLIHLAQDLAERRIQEGTASAQEIVHFLKLGSSREKLEQERLAHENQLTQAKIENLESLGRIESLYSEAIEAMQIYSGRSPVRKDEDDYDG